MTKIWEGMIKQLFAPDGACTISDVFRKAEVILDSAYASSGISCRLPNKSDIGQQLTK